MSNDTDRILTDLEASYDYVQTRRKIIRIEVRQRYKRMEEREIENQTRALENDFAEKIRAALEAGVSGTAIRTHVLHTQRWDIWKKWRDMSGAKTEVEVRREERAAVKNAIVSWDDRKMSVLVHPVTGVELAEPVEYVFHAGDTLERTVRGQVYAVAENEDVARRERSGLFAEWWDVLGPEIEKRAGELGINIISVDNGDESV